MARRTRKRQNKTRRRKTWGERAAVCVWGQGQGQGGKRGGGNAQCWPLERLTGDADIEAGDGVSSFQGRLEEDGLRVGIEFILIGVPISRARSREVKRVVLRVQTAGGGEWGVTA